MSEAVTLAQVSPTATGCRFVLCDSAALRRAVFAFRYETYVVAMQRRQVHADHARRVIEEPMDADGHNYAALLGDEVVATIRASHAEDPAARYYRRLYRVDELCDAAHAQVTTKLMIRSDLRRSSLGARLLAFYGADRVQRGMRVDVMDCNAPLVPMFEGLGYHSYCGWVFHREFGTVRAMFTAADTLRWFHAIGSPLGRMDGRLVADDAYGGYALVRRMASPPTNPVLRAPHEALFGPAARA
jgi:hypothetical protein